MEQNALAFDIETVGLDWDDFDADMHEYLLRKAETEQEQQEVKQSLALHPGTGRIIAIGMWRCDDSSGGVMIEGDDDNWSEKDGVRVFSGSEASMLAEFWRIVGSKDIAPLVSYNGRAFDGPFLMLRSAMLGVEPSVNLVPYRFSFRYHCDLAEVISFFGAKKRESFSFWCKRFGVASSKNDLSGADVGSAYERGELDRIARYCLSDARATAELYRKVRPLVSVINEGK